MNREEIFSIPYWQQAELKKQGIENPHEYIHEKFLEKLKSETHGEVVAVDAESGDVLWLYPAKALTHRSMSMADGKVVYHNYEALVALDATTGKPAWEFPTPWRDKGSLAWWRAYFGDLLVAEGKVFWQGSKTGGYAVNLADGSLAWEKRMSEDRGFTHPLGVRVIRGTMYRDGLRGGLPKDETCKPVS